MFIGNTYITPAVSNLPGQKTPVGPEGDFMALESALTDIVLLEDGGKIELE